MTKAPVARVGDMTSCGSKLIASQQAFSESGFNVGSIAQAAPLQSDISNSFVEDNEGSLIAGNTYVGDPDQGGGGLAGFVNYNPSPYDKAPEGYEYVWDGDINDMVLKPVPDEKSNFAVDPLAFVFPNTMGNFTNNPQVKSQTRLQSDLRKISNTATTIAGYGPYMAMGGKEAVSILPQSSINGASSGGALGGLSYIGTTPSEEWDTGKAFIYTTGGALTEGLGSLATTGTGLAAASAVGTYATQFTAEGEEICLLQELTVYLEGY